ncbi:isoprenyl transferase [Sciscionella sediminilitoris]|uniref:isoprenyl transferase n=1 Tax=Sciscionella sediminilitoris TaxID=1445613 RepID=UPI000560F720|nr:isoprenyl transferase [Sciscionella sp. SE31]
MAKAPTTSTGAPARPPDPHPSGARPPAIPAEFVPDHIGIVMDGNGRWANQRGMTRIEGHKRGEAVVLDVAKGCMELGVRWLSLYAFSTENWRRSPEEVRFLMGFNRDVIARRVDELDEMGVRIRWAGRKPKLWGSVVRTLQAAQERTKSNTVLNLTMCVNYGGRAEIGDAAREIAQRAAAGELNPNRVDERTVAKYLYQRDMPDVDLLIRPSGERRTSNFLVWQSAYAEMVYQDVLWPDYDRRRLWEACETYARRDRRFGGATDAVTGTGETVADRTDGTEER